ncbi:MAG: glutamine-hydrolyzing GMP synthase [Bacteroidia bacterium]|nr:glutamine-hydrolyzing GMP synthase [Bacteroidia bacterium]
MPEKILIIDFGSQYTQLIAKRVRELNVYSEIVHYSSSIDLVNVSGIILSGGPASVYQENAPDINLEQFLGKVPVLGICYGAQLLAHRLGGKVAASSVREYGPANLKRTAFSTLLERFPNTTQVWMSHGDAILAAPKDFEIIAETDQIAIIAFQNVEKGVYGLQFHPEVTHTEEGLQYFKNFILGICKSEANWTSQAIVEQTVANLAIQMPTGNAVCGLSGGVDSSVAASLAQKAIGKRLFCIFVDNGLLRQNEYEQVLEQYSEMGLTIIPIKAGDKFLTALKGVIDPEEKRKIIGKIFVDVFLEEAAKITNVCYLIQGTIYPDVIESKSVKGPSASIKTHHNVGGLPQNLPLTLVEPLRFLFKDDVRRVGKEIKVHKDILRRHPFPGPGLAIRVIGEITEERLEILRKADAVFIQELKNQNLYRTVWQAFAVLLPVQSVGVMGDGRTYENVLALRAVTSIDGMTADWAKLPPEFLSDVSAKITNTVHGVNRVVYDISSKPPATIEWE